MYRSLSQNPVCGGVSGPSPAFAVTDTQVEGLVNQVLLMCRRSPSLFLKRIVLFQNGCLVSLCPLSSTPNILTLLGAFFLEAEDSRVCLP